MPNYKTTLVNLARIVNIDNTTYLPTTIKVAYLGTGTPDATKFLRGDGTWSTTAGTANLQQVLNIGNAVTNSGTNVGTIVLTDAPSTKSTTLYGLGLDAQQLRLEGNTSGSVLIKAGTVTTDYNMILPPAQATAPGQVLTNNGTGVLSWTTPSGGSGNPSVWFSGVGVPTNVLGAVTGNYYWNTATRLSYLCTAVNAGVQTWTPQPNLDSYVVANIDAEIPNQLVAGSNVTLTTDPVTRRVTIASGGGGGGSGVTSVSMTVPTGLAVSGTPITTAGTLALSWSGFIPTTSLASGTPDATRYLRGDGTWALFPTPSSGTVTSVNMSVPTGFTISGGPITTSGTFVLSYTGQIPTSSLGTGSADNTTFLRGDGAWVRTVSTITSPNSTIAIGVAGANVTLDIAQQGATTNQVLSWNGTKWAPSNALSLTAGSGISTSVAGGTTTVSTNLSAGTGIGITSGTGTQLVITNTGSGTAGSSNVSTFVNQQFGFNTLIRDGEVYIGMGYQLDTEIGDGGFIGNTKYIGTPSGDPTGAGNGIIWFVKTLYTQMEVLVYQPSMTFTVTTDASVTQGFSVNGCLFAKKNYSGGSPTLNANLWPPLQAQSTADFISMVALKRPTVTVTPSTGTSFTVTIGDGVWESIGQNYNWTENPIEYIAYLGFQPVEDQINITAISNLSFASNTAGGIRCLVAIPGTSGATPSLQQVLAIGNITNGENLALTNNSLLTGASSNYSFSDGTSGQVLTKGAGNTVSWASGGSNSPLDVLVWSNIYGVEYSTDNTFALTTVTGTFNAFATVASATISLASGLTGVTTGSYVIGQTANGLTVNGMYTAPVGINPATVTQLNAERNSNFQPSTAYNFTWRLGKRTVASLNVDANSPSVPSRVDQLGLSSNLTLTADIVNPGRFIADINTTAETNRIDARIATNVGDFANPTNSNFVQLGTTTLSTSAGWFNGPNNTSELDIATANYTVVFNWLTGLGATAPVGGTGDWALPATDIYIASQLTPTATQFGIINRVSSVAASSTLSIFVPRTTGLGSGTAQGIFFIDGSQWIFQEGPDDAILRDVRANSVPSVNNITANPVNLVAGAGITVNTDVTQRTITITNSTTSGTPIITTLPVISFTGSATASANQTFRNTGLLSYASADYISVTVNGAVLNRAFYNLTVEVGPPRTGVLTISAFIPASCVIQVQPSGGGGSTGYFTGIINTSTLVANNTNFLLAFPTTGNNLTAFSYASDVFTATRNVAATINLQVCASSLSSCTQLSIWMSYNGDVTTGTRFAQRTIVPNAGSSSISDKEDPSTTWTWRFAMNDTVRFYVYGLTGANFNIGNSIFGGEFTRLSIVELFG